MNEQWMAIPGYDCYEVSDMGRVRSWKRRATVPRLLKLTRDTEGYLRAGLSVHGVARSWLVHRLVLLAFVGQCPPGMESRHLDGTRDGNRLANLRYGTRVENQADRIIHGTSSAGERHGRAKLSSESVTAIRITYAAGGVTQAELGRRYGVTPGAIWCVISRRSWGHTKTIEEAA